MRREHRELIDQTNARIDGTNARIDGLANRVEHLDQRLTGQVEVLARWFGDHVQRTPAEFRGLPARAVGHGRRQRDIRAAFRAHYETTVGAETDPQALYLGARRPWSRRRLTGAVGRGEGELGGSRRPATGGV